MRPFRAFALASLLLCGCRTQSSQSGSSTAHIYWDAYGVASVIADRLDDGMYALGYAQAKEFAVRMAESYKLARGRLAEVRGQSTLLQDGVLRGIGLEDAAIAYEPKLAPDKRAILQAFCDGANKFLAENRSQLPSWIQPFTIVDVLALTQLANIAFPLQELQGQLGVGVGSNQFAISGKRTSTGHPILSLDPHLGLEGENGIVWQEFGFYAGGIKFRGICIPGLPAAIAGHSDRIAWSVTNNDPALVTVYQVKTNPANSKQYSFHGQWRDFQSKTLDLNYLQDGKLTTFKQSGKFTAWGPMIPLSTMAVRFAPVGDFHALDEALEMMRARNVDEFRSAIKPAGLSMWNYVAADVDGNIAYQYNAHLPKRDASLNWRRPVDGSAANTAWRDELWSIEELPHAKNPKSGLLVNCNSAPWLTTLGDEIVKLWPNYVTSYGHTSRYDRLAELLAADRKVSPEKAMRYATDTLIPNAYSTAQRLSLYGAQNSEEVKVLRRWDGRAEVDSVGTALYLAWLKQDRSNVGLASAAGLGTAWNAEQTASAVRTLAEAGKKLRSDMGSVAVAWGKVLRLVRGDKQAPCGGYGYYVDSNSAVRPTSGAVQPGGWIRANFGSSTRMIVSLEPKGLRSWSVLPFGNSDDPKSPHYSDQMELYGAGKYKPDPFGPEEVRKAAKETLDLKRQ